MNLFEFELEYAVSSLMSAFAYGIILGFILMFARYALLGIVERKTG